MNGRAIVRLAGLLIILIVIIEVAKWEQNRINDEKFQAVFGIATPTGDDRGVAMLIVQGHLARLEKIANEPPDVRIVDSSAAVQSSTAALQRWLTAYELAYRERLTQEDAMQDSLRRVAETLKRTEALIKTFPKGKSGTEIIKELRKKK